MRTPRFWRLVCVLGLVAAVCGGAAAQEASKAPPRKYTNLERLALPRLEAAHRDVLRLREERRDVALRTGLQDYRSILHAHAEDSDHTGGTRPEMLADAQKTDVRVIMLTDHFRPPRDFIEESWRGVRDGVLFIPGSEAKGFLLYPMRSVMDKMAMEGPEFVSAITADGGLIFLSHVEERPEHPMDGLTGMEIVNRHYDAKRDMPSLLALAAALTDPAKYAEMREALRRYPDELLAAQQDYPSVYIDKWDAEMQQRRVVGIAANDCHHNQVLIAKMVDEETVLVGTIVDADEEMRRVTAADRPGIREMTRGKKPGDIVAKLDLDPYHVFFHDLSTHILAKELSETAIRDALRAGHAYVAFDWMCDPTGFAFGARRDGAPPGELAAVMGDEASLDGDLRLVAEFPVACDYRIIKNGHVAHEGQGRDVEFTPDGPGAYRIEGRLTIDDELRTWILSNPVYVRE
jgi:hypothetical protein